MSIAVLGAGSWGTALAIHLARNHQTVILWGRDENALKKMTKDRKNKRYLPDVAFPDSLQLQTSLQTAVQEADYVLMVVPSFAFVPLLREIQPWLGDKPLVSATKGMYPETGQFFHQKVSDLLGSHHPFAVLAGPSFAKEVAAKMPTAITVAANQTDLAERVVQDFHSPYFRVYTNTDLVGVELGGVYKNILAVASGISDGLKLGSNARAALITRGLAEMMRLGKALGAHSKTLMGLTGCGDVILTCTDDQSRNRRFGLALGKGAPIKKAEEQIGQVVEARHNAKQVMALADAHCVSMPIADCVNRVLEGTCTLHDALDELTQRNPTEE